jgi:hypothetical protein
LRGHVAEQLGERARLKPKDLFKPCDGLVVGCAAALLPLPYGASRPTDCPADSTLRQPTCLAGTSERAAESLPLFTAAVHPARIAHLLVAVEGTLLEGFSMH